MNKHTDINTNMRGGYLTKKITVLPSLIICRDGSTRELDSLSDTEKQRIVDGMCRNIGNAMSDYYTSNRNEWANFVTQMSA